jgi:hypothetical protein
MTTTYVQPASAEAAAYGGLVDALGGVATIVLAIIALGGIGAGTIPAIATIVFGAALLIQGGTMLSEYSHIIFPIGTASPSMEHFGGGSLSVVFLVGAAGVVLGVLALLGIAPAALTAAAVIAFGSALVLSSNSVRHLYLLKTSASRMAGPQIASEFVAGEMTSSSAGVQTLAGLAAIILGILAVAGHDAAGSDAGRPSCTRGDGGPDRQHVERTGAGLHAPRAVDRVVGNIAAAR